MVTLLDIFWAIIYFVSFFGSLSFGYLVLRFNIPDIRIVPREAKLGLSGLLGIGIFALSIGASYFLGVSFLAYIPLWTLVFTGLFQIQQIAFAKKNMTVILPVAKMQPIRSERKIEMRPHTALPQVLSEREYGQDGKFGAGKPVEQVIMPKEEPEIRPEREEKEIEQAREDFKQGKIKEIVREPEYRPSRRRYMERRGEMVEEAKTDMFRASDLKDREKAEKELDEGSAPATDLSIQELSEGLDIGDIEKIGSIDELSELGLGDLEGMSSKSLDELAGLAEPQVMARQKGMVCPKCSAKNTTIVYCPYCGKGFCSNCSDQVQRKGELIFYGCPTCKKEVIVKAES